MLYDPTEATRELAAADPALGALIEAAGPCTLVPRDDAPFPALLRAVVYQQLSGKAAATILGRVLALFDGEAPAPAAFLAVPEDALRAAGLSRAKTAAVRDLALKAETGTLPSLDEVRALDDAEVIQRLTEVRGVGPWTVEMYLLFGLGRPDVWPVTDLGVQEGYRLTFGGERPSPAALAHHGERWRPRRSVAAWYLWRAVDLARAR